MLQGIVRKLFPTLRVAGCCRSVLKVPEIWHRPARESDGIGKAFFKGLMVCGSVWICPVCAAKITERRRQELIQGVRAWPGSIFMATFTLQHDLEDHLDKLRDHLNFAYRKLKSGRWYANFEKENSIIGSISGLEITVSKGAGWHPHKHVIFFSKDKGLDRGKLEKELSNKFIEIMKSLGVYVSAIYGVKVEAPRNANAFGDEGIKKYIAKWGLEEEITKSPVKAGKIENGILHYSPFQLLDLVGVGDNWAAGKFQEYARIMKGTKQLVWSKGLREELRLAIEEKSDEQLAEEPVETGDVLLHRMSWQEWHTVLGNDARAELLEVADKGDEEEVKAFLEKLPQYKTL